jgi:hypothetical protein
MPKFPPAAVVFAISLTLYWLTTPADLTTAFYGADGGELITAAVTLGIPHPPGYPTYVLLGHLLSYWPWGIVAYRFNLWSGLCMAAAAALLTHTPPRPAVLPGLLFATLPLVWQTAIITEVYALNLLVMAIGFYLLLTRPSPPAAFWFGLAVTTHLTSLFLLPLLFLHLRPGQWKPAGLYYLLGLTPFLLLFPLAHTSSPVQWGYATTPAAWLWLVTAQIYWPNSFGLSNEQFIGRLTTWLPLLLYHFFYLALPFFIKCSVDFSPRFLKERGLKPSLPKFSNYLSLFFKFHKKRSADFNPHLLTNLEIYASLPLFATITLYLLYAFSYAPDDALVFTLPAFYLFSLNHSLQLFTHNKTAAEPVEEPFFSGFFRPSTSSGNEKKLFYAQKSLILHLKNKLPQKPFTLFLFFSLFIFHLSSFIFPLSYFIFHISYFSPRSHFQALRPHIPDHALLITTGRDLTLYPLWYFHHVEGQGENWDMIDSDLLAFAWYRHHLQQQNPQIQGLTEDNLPRLIEENQPTRPVCLINLPNQTLTCH